MRLDIVFFKARPTVLKCAAATISRSTTVSASNYGDCWLTSAVEPENGQPLRTRHHLVDDAEPNDKDEHAVTRKPDE
jgi:hypothetical protein